MVHAGAVGRAGALARLWPSLSPRSRTPYFFSWNFWRVMRGSVRAFLLALGAGAGAGAPCGFHHAPSTHLRGGVRWPAPLAAAAAAAAAACPRRIAARHCRSIAMEGGDGWMFVRPLSLPQLFARACTPVSKEP